MIMLTSEPRKRATVSHYTPSDPKGQISSDMLFFAGTVPFVWSLEVYLQEILQPVPQWFVSVHLTAEGAVTRVLKSDTVAIQPDQVCAVPFTMHPLSSRSGDPQPSSGYFLESYAAGNSESGTIEEPSYVFLKMTLMEDLYPRIEVVDTRVRAEWIIGARDIVLTDPPVVIGVERVPDGRVLIEQSIDRL